MSDTYFDVVVIGAGFEGLATTAALRRYGVPRVCLLEGGQRYGTFWEANYDRISLHTPWHGLPDDGGDNDRYAMFKPRDELLEYFARYAEHHQLAEVTRFGEMVSSISRDETDGQHPWLVSSTSGDLRARFVVVSTGYCRVPVIPDIENMDGYTGELLHSKAYRNGDTFGGKHMLVVGTGNSGAEIATELVESGAASVTMLGYGPRFYLPIEPFSELLIQAREMGAAGPEGIINLHPFTPGTEAFKAQLDAFDEMIRPLAEDLTAFGIGLPTDGPLTEFFKTHRVPVIDQGAAPLIRSGDIEVIKDRIVKFTAAGVQLAETGHREFDAVILCTGFEPGLQEFVPSELTEVVSSHGHVFPKTDGRCASSVYDDIYFVGFDQALMSGQALGLWGFEVAEKIASALGTFSPEQRPSEFSRAPWETAT